MMFKKLEWLNVMNSREIVSDQYHHDMAENNKGNPYSRTGLHTFKIKKVVRNARYILNTWLNR